MWFNNKIATRSGGGVQYLYYYCMLRLLGLTWVGVRLNTLDSNGVIILLCYAPRGFMPKYYDCGLQYDCDLESIHDIVIILPFTPTLFFPRSKVQVRGTARLRSTSDIVRGRDHVHRQYLSLNKLKALGDVMSRLSIKLLCNLSMLIAKANLHARHRKCCCCIEHPLQTRQ